MRLSYAPTRQFSAALVILCEELRYAHISRELPGTGLDSGIRTHGPMLPKHVRYQLRYIQPWGKIGRIAVLQCAASEKATFLKKPGRTQGGAGREVIYRCRLPYRHCARNGGCGGI